MNREERIAHAEGRLRELLEKGATLDDVLNGPEGHAWIEESCAGDRELAFEALRRVYPSARQVEPEE